MKALIFLLFALLVGVGQASAQLPAINGVAGPSSSDQLRSIITNPTGTGSATFAKQPRFEGINETATTVAITANTLTLDLSTGTVFVVTSNSNINAFVFSNATAAVATGFTIFFIGNGVAFTQNWVTAPCSGCSIRFPASAGTPTLTSTLNQIDVVSFRTYNGTIFLGTYNLDF